MLALVVAGAACVEPAIADGRLERRRDPGVEWIGRLDVVVTVQQHRRRAGRVGAATQHHRPAGGRHDPRIQAQLAQQLHQELGDLAHTKPVCADARPANVVDQPVDKRRAVGVDVGEDVGQIGGRLRLLVLHIAVLRDL